MYNYQNEKSKLLTDGNQKDFLALRDHVLELLQTAGAVRIGESYASCRSCSNDSWLLLAMFDRMVELGDIKEVTSGDVPGQHRVFVRK